eukprot:gnl/Chilomastix_cuspidata/2812.p1 GENE.gnl/Chilomastix_cuspidata/2812~~gnl/Chilomastix_cuspidata/2812.p1  ORF type:complete len:493 (+),score=201.68 gnl/Chilomastix_cuspidata/2812:196-1479(+)
MIDSSLIFRWASGFHISAKDKIKGAMEELESFAICESVKHGGSESYNFSSMFTAHILARVACQEPPRFAETLLTEDEAAQLARLEPMASKAPDAHKLNQYASGRWLKLFHALLGLQQEKPVTKRIIGTLLQMGILENAGGAVAPTPDGYRFTLSRLGDQLWMLAGRIVGRKLYRLVFLLRLLSLPNHVALDEALVAPRFRGVYRELALFGFVFASGGAFFTLPVLRYLTNDEPPTSATGYLIVEPTFAIYAYTDNVVHERLLGLFALPRYKLPGLLVFDLEPGPCKAGMRKGIHAADIARFLMSHSKQKAVPSTVLAKLKAWEGQINRVRASPGCMFTDPRVPIAVYTETLARAAEEGALLWVQKDARNVQKAQRCMSHNSVAVRERAARYLRRFKLDGEDRTPLPAVVFAPEFVETLELEKRFVFS